MTASLDDYCSACGYRKPPDAESCPDCGARFATAAPPPPAAPAAAAPDPPPSMPAEPAAAAPDPPPAASPSGGRRFVSLFAVDAPPAPRTEAPRAVPSAAPPPPAAPPDAAAAPPPGYATVWPPVSAVRPAAPPPPPPAPPPEPAAAPPPPAQPSRPAPPPPDLAPPPQPDRAPWLRGRGLAIGGVVLAIALIGLGLALIPKGAPHRAGGAAARATATPTATATAAAPRRPSLAAQVAGLDALMRMSERGRAAAVRGDFAAAAANRARLARRIGRLRAHADDAALRAGLGSLAAAVREALRQNRTCAAHCDTADLARVGRLKQDALNRLNPLLRRYAHTAYRRAQI